MANRSNYASRFLAPRTTPGEPSGPSSSSSSSAPPRGTHTHTHTHRPPQPLGVAASHVQFDPLLRSTFGHRSADLYGSQVNDDGPIPYGDDSSELDGDDGDDDQQPHPNHRTRSNRFGGSSSLINASRHGPSRSRHNLASSSRNVIPEDDDDDDDDDGGGDGEEGDDGEDEERRWARGLNMKAFGRGGRGSSELLESAEADEDKSRTPNASFLFSANTPSRAAAAAAAAAAAGGRKTTNVDPFELDDDLTAAMPVRRPGTTDDSSVTNSTLDETDLESHRGAPSSTRGKGKEASKDRGRTTPNVHSLPRQTSRDVSEGRGWLAHSIARPKGSTGKPGKKVRPPRDAYSIYDDEEDDEMATSDEGVSEQTSSEDEAVASRVGPGHSASTSTLHHPPKLSASSFPRSGADDFHKKLTTSSSKKQHSAGTEVAGADSVVMDTYKSPSSLGSELTSWKPWARGNNPSWREWKDQSALAVWVAAIIITIILAGGASLGLKSPSAPSTPAIRPSPYYTLTRSLPLLILLSTLSLGMAVLNLALLRNLDRLGGARILRYALIGTPTLLTLGWIWAFAGSFFYADESWTGGLWTTTGLRFISLFPLGCAILFSRVLYMKQAQLGKSLSVLALSAKIVSAHPALLWLSLAQILVFLIVSIPFLTIFIRLFLIGHFTGTEDSEWITDNRARLLSWLTLGTWIWTWAALRGVMRVVVASTVAHWYFHGPPSPDGLGGESADVEGQQGRGVGAFTAGEPVEPAFKDDADGDEDDEDDDEEAVSEIIGLGSSSANAAPGAWAAEEGQCAVGEEDEGDDDALAHRNPTASSIVRSSFLRATGPSLGTVLLSALLLAVSRALILLSILSRYLATVLSSPSIPAFLHPLAHLAYLLSSTGSVIKGISDYTLIYTGITGSPFWSSTRRCSRILSRRGVQGLLENLLISTLLSLLTISLSFLAALAGFLFSAHQLHVPADAPLVGLLCGVVPFWTLRLAADVLGNGADTIYLCYAIDSAASTTVTVDPGTAGTNTSTGTGAAAVGGGNSNAETAAAVAGSNADDDLGSQARKIFLGLV